MLYTCVMSTITFDTHKFVRELRDAGIAEPQAEAFVRAQQDILAQALDTALATKSDITEVKLDIARLGHEIGLVKWVLGVVLALVIANFAKQFF